MLRRPRSRTCLVRPPVRLRRCAGNSSGTVRSREAEQRKQQDEGQNEEQWIEAQVRLAPQDPEKNESGWWAQKIQKLEAPGLREPLAESAS